MSIVNLRSIFILSIIKQEKEYKKETPEYMESDRESTPLNPTLAQLVEHMIVAHVVVGSNPASRIKSKTKQNNR